MSWKYVQATGNLIYEGQLVAKGYSGYGPHRNDQASERTVNLGPVPRGQYTIGDRFDSEQCGPICMHLTPLPGTDTFGRGGFLIHGDDKEHPGLGSHGCIVLLRIMRIAIAASTDRLLEVV